MAEGIAIGVRVPRRTERRNSYDKRHCQRGSAVTPGGAAAESRFQKALAFLQMAPHGFDPHGSHRFESHFPQRAEQRLPITKGNRASSPAPLTKGIVIGVGSSPTRGGAAPPYYKR